MKMTDHSPIHNRFSVAPMLQWTDEHWRYFASLITKKTLLYTEMINDHAIVYNPQKIENYLGIQSNVSVDRVAIQLGGNDPELLSDAAYLCSSFGNYSEINLNAGCPSNKAKRCGYGAELMLYPEKVREILYAMRRKCSTLPISVKCRIGVTNRESYEDLVEFVHQVSQSGVRKIIIHSRICVLRGLSPAQNRNIPPLKYDIVHKIARQFPEMEVVLNGGIESFDAANFHMGLNQDSHCVTDYPYEAPVQGIMMGREVYRNPFILAKADETFYPTLLSNNENYITRKSVLIKYLDYALQCQQLGVYGSYTCNIIKPLHNIFHGCKTNNLYKQKLDFLIKKNSKIIDQKRVHSYLDGSELSDMISLAMEDTIPKSFLEERIFVS